VATKDLTTYTETDASSVLSVSASTVTYTAWPENVHARLSKDYGADYFDAIDHDFELVCDAYVGGGSYIAGHVLATADIEGIDHAGTTDLSVISNREVAPYGMRIMLQRGNWVAYDLTGNGVLSEDSTYYLTLSRAAGNDTATLYIYSNAARTSLMDTLVVAGFGTVKWRWHQAANQFYQASTNTQTGRAANYDFNDAAAATCPVALLRTRVILQGGFS
jgi:hypothetical protein